MLKFIIYKELKEYYLEGKIRWAAIITTLLLFTSILISYQSHKSQLLAHTEASEIERRLWGDQGEKNPHSAAHYGTYVFKLNTPLSIIDPGLNKYVGVSIFLEAHNRNTAEHVSAADQSGLSRFGELTPDFILLYIIPLLIILLGYNSVSREYEHGTLKLIKTQGVSMVKVMFGKWICVFSFSIALLVFTIVSILLLFSFSNHYTAVEIESYIAFFVLYPIYYAILVNIVLLISGLSKHSSRSLVASLLFWIVFCFGAPKAASSLANSYYPYPSKHQFHESVLTDKKQGLDGHNPWNTEAKKLEEETLAKYGVDSLHKLPFNYAGYRMQKGEEHEAKIYSKHYSELKSIAKKQEYIYQMASIFSPFIPTRFSSMGIARTDYSHHWHFSDKAEKYRIEMVKALNMDLAENSSFNEWTYKAGNTLWESIPKFRYNYQELNEILEHQQTNILILGLWFFLTTCTLFIACRKV